MKTIIDKKELINNYPLVERTISIDKCRIVFDYELIGDLDLCFTFSKKYKNSEEALATINKFIHNEKEIQNKSDANSMNFQEQLLASKKKLITDIINQEIDLPDKGIGYKYNGDINYLKHLMNVI